MISLVNFIGVYYKSVYIWWVILIQTLELERNATNIKDYFKSTMKWTALMRLTEFCADIQIKGFIKYVDKHK